MMHPSPLIRVALGFCAAAWLPLDAHAALGDTTQSIDQDRTQLEAQIGHPAAAAPAPAAATATAASRYSVREFTTTTGTRVREFVDAGGTVFAVSWQGPFMPDLRVLLGASIATLQQTPRPRTGLHSSLSLESPDLVVHSQGHVRAFAGQAYLPRQLPAGVRPEQLQ